MSRGPGDRGGEGREEASVQEQAEAGGWDHANPIGPGENLDLHPRSRERQRREWVVETPLGF